ncbi:MAG: CGNR zinc finger domain-containing protein [Actinomycetota bacterium]|nr:CGNR zinc finger domain-containing protein [Actinomycetota bacterium]
MIFTHDTEVALQAAAALVNTLDDTGEHLTVQSLDAFVNEWGWTGERRRDEAELAAVRRLRPRLRQLWAMPRDEVVDLVNHMLREARALPQLVKHDHWDYHLHATPDNAPLATRMAVEAAMALIDVIRADELSRLRICDYLGCGNVVVDLSKNRSKRYCDNGCGNRSAVAAYRARQRESVSEQGIGD